MKKITLSVLAVLTIAASITSCKKGEGDPAISFKSRKARVAGEWTVTKLERDLSGSTTNTNDKNSNSNGSTYTETMTHDGSAISVKRTSTSTNNAVTFTPADVVSTGTVTEHSITIEKDGTYSSVYDFNTSSTTNNTQTFGSVTVTTTTKLDQTYKKTVTGTWNFLGKIGEAKNKESIILSAKTEDIDRTTTTTTTNSFDAASKDIDVDHEVSSTTYAENESTEIWKITQLKSKEMLVEGTEDMTGTSNDQNTNTSVDASGSVTTTGPKYTSVNTAKATTKFTFTAK